MEPVAGGQEHGVVGEGGLDLLPLLFGPLAVVAGPLSARVLLTPHSAEELVPDLEKETAVVRVLHAVLRLLVVKVVLVRRVDDGVVGGQPWELVAPVQVHAVAVEEESPLEEHDVHVDGDQQREHQQWCAAHELVNVFVGNYRERASGTQADAKTKVNFSSNNVLNPTSGYITAADALWTQLTSG